MKTIASYSMIKRGEIVNDRGSVMIVGERARLKEEHWRSRLKEQTKPNIRYFASFYIYIALF